VKTGNPVLIVTQVSCDIFHIALYQVQID